MIVITGASQGLGKELSKLYIGEGKKVIGLARSNCEAGVEHIKTDLLNEQSINNAAKQILAADDPIEAIINCAGVYSEEALGQLTAAELERVFQTNVFAPMLLVAKLIGRIKTDGSDIVNVSSTVGTKAYSDQAAYGSSKWALRGFSYNLQLELKTFPCRVVSFCPGGFQSNLVKNFNGSEIADPENWMAADDVAKYLKQILELPKNMEVSEVTINRKQPK
jgi:short-subunit dehydrogenase